VSTGWAGAGPRRRAEDAPQSTAPEWWDHPGGPVSPTPRQAQGVADTRCGRPSRSRRSPPGQGGSSAASSSCCCWQPSAASAPGSARTGDRRQRAEQLPGRRIPRNRDAVRRFLPDVGQVTPGSNGLHRGSTCPGSRAHVRVRIAAGPMCPRSHCGLPIGSTTRGSSYTVEDPVGGFPQATCKIGYLP
jgi:hypothetical protein